MRAAMIIINVYNENKLCEECKKKLVQYIISFDDEIKHLCKDCIIQKVTERLEDGNNL